MALPKYQKRGYDEVRRRAEQSVGNYDGIIKIQAPSFTPKEGTNCIRFLQPTWPDAEHYAFDVFTHRDIGPDKATYICPKEMGKGECPICEERVRLSADGASADDLKALRPGKRAIAWIIDRDNERNGPTIFNMSPSQDKDISSLCIDPRKGSVLLLDDPDDGYDLTFVREGQKLNTRYRGYQVDRNPSELSLNDRDYADWLEFVAENPIPDILDYKSYEYIASIFAGQQEAKTDREREVEEEEREPVRRSRSRDEEREPERTRDPDARRASRDEERETDRDRDTGRGRDREEERPRRTRDDREEERETSRGREREEPRRAGNGHAEDPPFDRDKEEPAPRSRGGVERASSRASDREREPEPERETSRSRDKEEAAPPRRTRRDEDKDEERETDTREVSERTQGRLANLRSRGRD